MKQGRCRLPIIYLLACLFFCYPDQVISSQGILKQSHKLHNIIVHDGCERIQIQFSQFLTRDFERDHDINVSLHTSAGLELSTSMPRAGRKSHAAALSEKK